MASEVGNGNGWQTIPGKKGKKNKSGGLGRCSEGQLKCELHGKTCQRRGSASKAPPLIPPNPKLNQEDRDLAERIRSHFHDLFKSGPAQYENPIVENGLKELDFASRNVIGKYPHLGEFLAEDPRLVQHIIFPSKYI